MTVTVRANSLGQIDAFEDCPYFLFESESEYEELTQPGADSLLRTKYQHVMGQELTTIFELTNLLQICQHFGWDHYSTTTLSQFLDNEPTATLILFFNKVQE